MTAGHRTVAIIQQRTEQRRARRQRAATLGKGQRSVFVSEQAGQAPMGLQDGVAGGLLGKVDTQRQGVDEHPQRALCAFRTTQPTDQHGAEHHCVATGQAAQHLSPGQMHQARRADAQLPHLIADALAQRGIQTQPGFARHFRPWQGGLSVRQGWLVKVAQLLAEERFMSVVTRPQQGMRDVIAVRHRHRQLRLLIEQHGLQLMAQQVERDVVHDQVMEQQHGDNALVVRVLGMHQTQQRRA